MFYYSFLIILSSYIIISSHPSHALQGKEFPSDNSDDGPSKPTHNLPKSTNDTIPPRATLFDYFTVKRKPPTTTLTQMNTMAPPASVPDGPPPSSAANLHTMPDVMPTDITTYPLQRTEGLGYMPFHSELLNNWVGHDESQTFAASLHNSKQSINYSIT